MPVPRPWPGAPHQWSPGAPDPEPVADEPRDPGATACTPALLVLAVLVLAVLVLVAVLLGASTAPPTTVVAVRQ